MRDGEVAIPVLRSASQVPWQTKGQRSMNEVNTLHWHDAKKQLPYNDTSSKIIAYKNSDEDNLQWMGAYFNGKDWIKETKIVHQGIRIEFEAVVPDVRYWSNMPTINFDK